MIKYIKQGWLVLFLALVFGGSLAGVHLGLMDRIESNKKLEILENVPMLVLGYDEIAGCTIDPKPLKDLVEVVRVEGTETRREGYQLSQPKELDLPGSGKYIVYEVRDTEYQDTMGYILRIKGQGFADAIEILVGIRYDDRLMIPGIRILDQKETPGLGDKITRRKWNSQFDNQPSGKMRVVQNPEARKKKNNQIDAITGATVSSKCVCGIVNQALRAVGRDWYAGNLTGFVYSKQDRKE